MNTRELQSQIDSLVTKHENEWIFFGNTLHEVNLLSISDLELLINRINVYQPTMLALANLGMNDNQICYLAHNLQGNNSIKHLSLPFNKIGDKGANALAELLKNNSSIIQLDIFCNQIHNAGMTAIANALIANDTLITLETFNNLFTTEMTEVFEKVLLLNHELEKLLLYAPLGKLKLSDKLLGRLADNKLNHEKQRERAGRPRSEQLFKLSSFSMGQHKSPITILTASESDSEHKEGSPYNL